MSEVDSEKLGEDIIHAETAPLFLAIGHVAHHFSNLEHQVNQTIWKIACIHPSDGACITAQISGIMPRFRALIALAHKHGCSEDLLKTLNRFASNTDGIARQRNRIIHDPWYFRQGLGTPAIEYGRLEITADRKLTYEVKSATSKEVLEVAHKIIDASKLFKKLQKRIYAEVEARSVSSAETAPESAPGQQFTDPGS
jgi:hypothetical protein